MELNEIGAIYNLNTEKGGYIFHKINSLNLKGSISNVRTATGNFWELQDPGKGATELEDRDVFVDGGQVIISSDPLNPFALKLFKLPPSMMGVALKIQPKDM